MAIKSNWKDIKILYCILFIISFICITSIDYFGRYIFPKSGIIINVIMIFFALVTAMFFFKLTNIKFKRSTNKKKSEHSEMVLIDRNIFKPILKEKDPLLVLRFLAALLVFITHMAILLHPPVLKGFNTLIWGSAWSGMTIFFTLSGYLMGKAFLKQRYTFDENGIFTFYQSRFVRIFPLMFFVFLVFCVFLYPQILRYNLLSVIRVITFNYYGNTLPYNGIGAIWSLSVEMQYYIIAPFIFFVFNKIVSINKRFGFSSLIAIIVLIQSSKVITNEFIFSKMGITPNFFSLFGNLPFFLTGFMFNYFSLQLPKWSLKILNTSLFQVIMMVLSIAGISLSQGFLIASLKLNPEIYYLAVSICTGLSILVLESLGAFRKENIPKKFDFLSIIQILGVLSYGFYLWHSGIASIYSTLFTNGFQTIGAYVIEVLIIFIIVLLISLISFIVIENRFNKYKAINIKLENL